MSKWCIKSKLKLLYLDSYNDDGSPKFTDDIDKAWKFQSCSTAISEIALAGIDFCVAYEITEDNK